ncbi:MAG TPA: YbaB/EbfC family nucleoid-associated protein [Candidatus Atribacteria bacterium]|nr:YbaB/EbfC family nucleoid-associated protein [Candidatus Atribacteria bacterium]
MAKGLQNLMKQAQELQKRLERVQEELGNMEVEATSGGGMVKVVANGKQEVLDIKIDKEVINPEDKGMLEDLVLAAVNEALRKSRELASEEMSKVTGGMMPPQFM